MLDTIVGIATAAGEGGIAIVRISGKSAVSIFEQVFIPRKQRPPFQSHRLMVGRVMDGEQMIDEAMGVVMYAPETYTREDVCEIHTHGGNIAATLVLRLLVRLGARPSEAGEFTRRAFMNGRIDLMQAEAVMGVISAQSAAALKAEERQLTGGQSVFIRNAQVELTGLLSGLEAHIDYPDEIDEEEALKGLRTGLLKLTQTLSSAIDERGARIVREGLHVALCGRPNAGKSTLFNALLGEERAIVTDIPGTTRDVLEGAFSLDGVRVLVQDTAGLRKSDDTVERIGVERAHAALEQADVALVVVDGSTKLAQEELELLSMNFSCPCAVLLNKEDAGEALSIADAEKLTPHRPIFRISAKTMEGLDEVRDYLRGFLKTPQQLLLTHERHMAVAGEALSKLQQAMEILGADQPLDLAAVDMHEALYLLGRITGESVDEKLLDDIFSRFCVGK
ncbi:MAG: tRNA uridine-5-carboxymethylaminomethyl(34) synthesis GTPase MnmE [Clostridiales bacterium]|nr:tRNA uridine-5-carboxymethylaminomethyl(34) synthesis GTPase MnmE [Clostridiales bacterium]